jgi:hypothetical protein
MKITRVRVRVVGEEKEWKKLRSSMKKKRN